MIRTLWDLIAPRPAPAQSRAARAKGGPAQVRYEEMTRVMLTRYGVRVRRWRSSMSGLAWELRYRDGTTARLIEAPRPKGPMSAAIFLHEIGHHAIGFDRFKPRCLEEYHAWSFSIQQMHEWNLNITDGVNRRVRDSLHYALAKARRRGLREIPPELAAFNVRNRAQAPLLVFAPAG